MTNSVYNYAAKILVHFHIGRGGRFHDHGNKTYIGTVNGLSDCYGDAFIISEDENGNAMPDKDWKLLNGAGNIILEGREAIESPTGVLDWDGEYDTDIVRHISECGDDEYQLIIDAYNRHNYVDEDVLDYAFQATDSLHSKKITINGDSIDVQTQYKTATFERNAFSSFNEAKAVIIDMGFPERDAERISCVMRGERWF